MVFGPVFLSARPSRGELLNVRVPYVALVMDWEAERDMEEDVAEHEELYEALAASPEDE